MFELEDNGYTFIVSTHIDHFEFSIGSKHNHVCNDFIITDEQARDLIQFLKEGMSDEW